MADLEGPDFLVRCLRRVIQTVISSQFMMAVER
jgi:hypothetical protein